MQYEPIKHSIDKVISKNIIWKKIFFRLLDIHLLRTWHVQRELNHYIRRLEKQDISIMDAGSGFGQYSWFLVKRLQGCKLTGIDISEDHVKRANDFFQKAGYPQAEFIAADLTKYSKPDEFNLVITVDVMEHILDDVQVFRNFYTSMKSGGMLLISTPSDQGGSDVHSDHDESFIDEHVRDGYSIKEIRDKLLSVGFDRIDARYTYGRSGKISWKLAMKYPISMINASKLFYILLPFYFIVTYPFILIFNWLDLLLTNSSGTGLLVKAYK